MDKIGATLIRATMLATGAFLGALLARWCDQLLVTHSQKQSDYDKTRYAQGLGPLASPPTAHP